MKKIIFGIGMLFLLLSVACAADLVDVFSPPSTLQPAGTSTYVDLEGHNIMMLEYSEDNYQSFFENDTDYSVQKYNDTCYIGADDENDCYILEMVEKDGKKYIIGSWTPNGPADTEEIQSNLVEFNKINKLTPLTL